jgi:hypothetical protein
VLCVKKWRITNLGITRQWDYNFTIRLSNPREESLLSIWCRGWLDQSRGENQLNHLYGGQKFLHNEHFPGQPKTFLRIIETEDSLPCSQQPAGCSYSETDKYIPWPRIRFEIPFNTILPYKPRSSMYHLSFRSYNQNRVCNSLFLMRGKTPPILFSLTSLTLLAPVNEGMKYCYEFKRCGQEIIPYI